MIPDTGWSADILATHEAKLLSYAQSLIGDRDQARDFVQETFLRLMKQDPVQLNGRVTPWLYRVCRNLVIDHQRKERRMMHLASEPIAEQTPHHVIERKDLSQHVLSCVAQLPANQQEVVRLKFQAGMSYKEIAEVMGLSPSNVGFLLHTAISALRVPPCWPCP